MKNDKSISKLDIDYEYFATDMDKFVNDNEIQSPTDFVITTSIENKYTYIYKKSDDGEDYERIFKWLCSTGASETPTPEGIFNVIGRRPNFGSYDYQVRYATRFTPRYYYHSILLDGYGEKIKDDRLGLAITNGCIRLTLDNAKWIYDNIPDGTTVIIK